MLNELVLFGLGGLSAVALQVFVSHLALGREKRRETWVRKLNSYENFYRALTQLIDLLAAGVRVPTDQFWTSVGDARKSAYDAISYDPEHGERTALMCRITLELVVSYQSGEIDPTMLSRWRAETTAIRDAFYREEPAGRFLLTRRPRPRLG